MNPVIIAALCVQAFVSRISRLAGALLGYAITTGILIWGLNAYGEGQQIALFGIPVSQGMFVAACIFWYGYDTKHLLAVRQAGVAPAKVPG